MHARRVKRGHAAHADNQILGKRLNRNVHDAIAHPEEHRPVDLVHTHALGQLAQMCDLRVFVAVVAPTFNFGLLRHHLHEQQHRDDHARCDCGYQIESHGEEEGGHKRGHGAFRRGFAQVHHVAPA